MVRRVSFLFLVFVLSALAHATLVVVVPARDGLVIAADSRFTFMGAGCDGAFKILEPQRLGHTVAFVTGDSIFVAPPAVGTEPCSYLATAPRLLDLGAVVTAYLDRAGDDPEKMPQAGLAAACVRSVLRFQGKYPAALRGYRGRELASVVVASYDPARGAATIRHFAIRIDARTGRAEASRGSEMTLGAGSARGVWIYGETEYVNRRVYRGPGRRFLDPATLSFLDVRGLTGEVTVERAEAVAGNVIRAASREAEIDPPPSGIGGQIRVVVVGSGATAGK